MENKETTNPSMGSNELGKESSETNITANILAGTNTQLHLAAMGHKKKVDKKETNINNNETPVQDQKGMSEFLKADETDE